MSKSNKEFNIGDEVSYGFNGDWYPCGKVERISKTGKILYTTEGAKFVRQPRTGTYKRHQTWTLTHGIHDERNPHF